MIERFVVVTFSSFCIIICLYGVAELYLEVACFSIVVGVCLCSICDKNERLRLFYNNNLSLSFLSQIEHKQRSTTIILSFGFKENN